MIYLDRHRIPLPVERTASRFSQMRSAIDRLVAYLPAESLEACSARTGIPVEHLIKLNSNENPYGAIPAVREALGSYQAYHHYPDTQAAALLGQLSAYTGLDRSSIVLGHGSIDLIHRIWCIYLSEGMSVLSCTPTYSLYATTTTLYGASLRQVQSRGPTYELNLDLLLDSMSEDTQLIVVCSPNNPTGNVVPESVVRRLLETGRVVFLDEAYVEFSQQPRGLAYLVPEYPNLVVSRTLSKAFGLAGLRVGYALCQPVMAQALRKVQDPFTPNVAGLLAAMAALEHLEEIQISIAAIVRERGRLFELLASQPFLTAFPSQGNFILARIGEQVTLEQVRSAVEAQGLVLRYFPKLDGLHDFVRVTVGLPEHTERLALALAALDVMATSAQ